MRGWIVALLVVAACKGKDKAEAPEVGAMAPKVAVATVLANADEKPPILLLVDDAGMVRLAAAKTWGELDANELTVAKKTSAVDRADDYVRESYGFDRDPVEAVKAWDSVSETDIDLEDTSTALHDVTQDDPPEPEPEDEDDGSEESGGTGMAITLEEGKMGKKESERAEGQYKMMKANADPVLARNIAIERARTVAVPGRGAEIGVPWNDKVSAREDGLPTRVAEVAGVVATDGHLDRLHGMIVISATAKATRLIEIVRDTRAAIAVSHGGTLRPLHLQFRPTDFASTDSWIEARVSRAGVVIEAVPDAPIEVAAGDAKQLAAALDEARGARRIEADDPVDVLVDADVDVQRLLDVVVALDTAGVRVIGLGSTPPPEEIARRGHRIPTLRFGQPTAQGDLDKRIIRRVVRSARSKIAACYRNWLEMNPTLPSTVQVMFLIKPDGGAVVGNRGTGYYRGAASCIEDVIETLTFPKPVGGGAVQVVYPFTMQP